MSDPIVIGVLGSLAILSITLGLALPELRRSRARSRRLRDFVRAPREAASGAGRAKRHGISGWLEARLAAANVNLTPGELVLAMVIFGCGGAASVLALAARVDLGAAAFGGLVASLVPLGWLRARESRRASRFTEQLPDTVTNLANLLHAGFGLRQAIDQVAREAPEPTSAAFVGLSRDLALGLSDEAAFERLAARHPSDDTDLFVAAVTAHARIGGSLGRMLETIAATLRDRARVQADVRVLTSQQRYSAYVLAALPIIVCALLYVISPDYLAVLFTNDLMRVALAAAVALIVLGFIAMRALASVDV
ncbi:MAG TPA: type II secretion system F family protein [Candidatus Limnocylindria bacterium]|jgi:tight adherence protein B|nr:type II secretion system F family protein [Candidatus Limnocylindria bacterium]